MAKSQTNAAKKMVMKPCYRTQVVKAGKGKGTYSRKTKHANKAGRSGLDRICTLLSRLLG